MYGELKQKAYWQCSDFRKTKLTHTFFTESFVFCWKRQQQIFYKLNNWDKLRWAKFGKKNTEWWCIAISDFDTKNIVSNQTNMLLRIESVSILFVQSLHFSTELNNGMKWTINDRHGTSKWCILDLNTCMQCMHCMCAPNPVVYSYPL